MGKNYRSLGIAGVLIIIFIYTVYTNLFTSDRSREQTINDEVQIELEEESEVSKVNGNVAYEYVQIDEEPLNHDSNEDHHDHDHDHLVLEPEVRQLNIKAPDFELNTLEGNTIKLSDLRGKKVFINFWATWCPPCKEEMPHIQKYYENQSDNNVVILSINTTDMESGTKVIHEFVDEFQLTFPILLDEKGEVSIDYELLTIPTSVIINEQGTVIEQIIGPVTEDMLEQLLS